MTPLAWLGIAFTAVGLTLKVLAGMGIIPGDIGAVSEVYGIGMALLGKELWPGSPQSLAVKSRTSKMPPPVALALPLVFLLGCGLFEAAKPVLRTVLDIARNLCLLSAEEQTAAARDGLSAEQWCAVEENVRPFVDEVLAAKQRASGAAGLTSGDEVTP